MGAVVASAAGHVVAFAVFSLFLPCSVAEGELGEGDYGVVSVVPVSEPPPLPEVEHPPVPDQQFVSLPAPEREELPDEARFADRYDRRVEREMVNPDDVGAAQPVTRTPEAARRGTREGRAERSVATALQSPASESVSIEGEGEQRPRSSGGGATPTDLDPSAEPSEGEGIPEAPSPRGRGLDLSSFIPNASDPILRPGGRMDHLELDEGDRTLVNSERSIYWSFFERMKRQVQAEWDPMMTYRRNDPSGQLYRQVDRYTILDITLGPDGSLRDATVQRASGLDFLDNEAVRAMRAAAPFPNVPEGLKDENGLVAVRFGFLLSFDGRARLRRIPTD